MNPSLNPAKPEPSPTVMAISSCCSFCATSAMLEDLTLYPNAASCSSSPASWINIIASSSFFKDLPLETEAEAASSTKFQNGWEVLSIRFNLRCVWKFSAK